jgi:hypothetical protein
MGMGSHFILVLLRAEFSRDRNDSFLWKFCWSNAVREEENVRDGAVMRAWQRLGGEHRGRIFARMSWRECAEAMAIALLEYGRDLFLQMQRYDGMVYERWVNNDGEASRGKSRVAS